MYSGNTGFIEAARNGHLNILELLITKGASVDQKNEDGKIQLLSYLSIYLIIYLSFYQSFYSYQ